MYSAKVALKSTAESLSIAAQNVPGLLFQRSKMPSKTAKRKGSFQKVFRTTFLEKALSVRDLRHGQAEICCESHNLTAGTAGNTLQDLKRAVMMDEGVPEIYELRRQDTFMPRL
ncbi:MAG TPA: hypothetical protein V6C97_16965 [Oculatellaceae cyanobacterium]